MKKFAVALFIVSCILVFLSLGTFYLYKSPLEYQEVYASVNFSSSEIAGVDVNRSALTFGRIGRQDSSLRQIFIENEREFPVVANLKVEGNIEKFMRYEKSVKIDPGEKREIPFSVYFPEEENDGFYDGYVRFNILRS